MMTEAEVPQKIEEFTKSLDQLAKDLAGRQEWRRVHKEDIHNKVENMLYDFLENNKLI